jgi:hypothetical protein
MEHHRHRMATLMLFLQDRVKCRIQLVHSTHSPQYDQWHDPENISKMILEDADYSYMVPECASILCIGIVVIFVLTNTCGVFCPAIKGSARIRTMQMNRIGSITVVNEAHDRFCALLHHEGWAWYHAIIANEPGLWQVGIDLYINRLDVDFIVIDCFSSMVVDQSSVMSQVSKNKM